MNWIGLDWIGFLDYWMGLVGLHIRGLGWIAYWICLVLGLNWTVLDYWI